MHRQTATAVALAFLLGASIATPLPDSLPETRRPSDVEIGLLQFAGGEACGSCCIAAGGALGYYTLILALIAAFDPGNSDQDVLLAGFYTALGIASLAPLASAGSVSAIGNRFYPHGERGSFGWTTLGAYTGLATALGIAAGGSALTTQPGKSTSAVWFVPALVMPQVGAVLAYHWSRPKRLAPGSMLERFEGPVIGFPPDPHAMGVAGINARLIGFRF